MSTRKASSIYSQQNRSIHKALSHLRMPYHAHKDELLATFTRVLGRKRTISGISGLTLGDRYKILKHFKSKGIRIMNPPVGRHLWQWKKGMDDAESKGTGNRFEPRRPLKVPAEKRPLVGKVHAVLADLKLPWSYADEIANQMHGVRVLEWCSKEQLNDVVVALVNEQRRQWKKQKRRFKALN